MAASGRLLPVATGCYGSIAVLKCLADALPIAAPAPPPPTANDWSVAMSLRCWRCTPQKFIAPQWRFLPENRHSICTIRSKRNLKRQDLSENGGSTLSQQPLLSKSKIMGVNHSGERRAVICVLGVCLSAYPAKAISNTCKANKQPINQNPRPDSRLTGGVQSKRTTFNTRKSQRGGAHS